MTTNISDLIDVTITRETTPVSRTGFGTLMVAGPHVVFNERIRFYQEPNAVLDDGFDSNSDLYNAVSLAFAQNPRPNTVAIGRRQVNEVNIEVTDPGTEGTEHTITINGTAFTHTAGVAPDADSVAAGLVSAIDAGSEPVAATDNNDGTLTIVNVQSGVAYTVEVSDGLAILELEAADDIADDLTAINNENNDFYAIAITSREQVTVEAAAAWVESQEFKIFGTASSDEDILDASSEDDLGFKLSDANYDRTFYIYHEDADTSFPEAAWLGIRLPTDPGTTTWAYAQVSGVPSSNLTSTERINLQNKNGNSYEARGGVNIFFEGTMASGEYIDIMRGLDWFKARLTENLYRLLVNVGKIPFTDGGLARIESQIKSQIERGIERNVIARTPDPVITIPRVRDIPFNDRANRELTGVRVEFTLAGAVHRIRMNVTATV